MISIAPTITAETIEDYTHQLKAITSFAGRIHIDLMDGEFTPTTSITPDQVSWPANVRADLHVMYHRPFEHTEALVALGPQLVIVHAETDGNFAEFAERLHHHGIEAGVALLPETTVDIIVPALDLIDHVLIFSGNLGHQGGSKVDYDLLEKATALRKLKPTLEIGWDGGVDSKNAAKLVRGGIDVLDVGGYIHKGSDSPQEQYDKIVRAVASVPSA